MSKAQKIRGLEPSARHWLVWLIYGLASLALLTSFTPAPIAYLSVTFWKVIPFQIIVELMLACWLSLIIVDRRYRPRFGLLAVAILLFAALALFSVPFSVEPGVSFWSSTNRMTGVFNLFHLVAWFFILASVLRRRSEWNVFLSISTSIASLIGAMAVIEWINQAAKIQIQTVLNNSSYLTSYILPHVFIALYLWSQRESPFRMKLWLSASSLLGFTVIIAASRAGILALLAGLAIFFLGLITVSEWSKRKKIITCSLSLLVIALMFGGFFALRTGQVRNWLVEHRTLPSFLDRLAFRDFGGDRLVLWDIAVKSITERPLFGWGNEQLAQAADKYMDPVRAKEVFSENRITRAHNQYLDTATSYGLVGLAAYLFLLAVLTLTIMKIFKSAETAYDRRSVIIIAVFFLSYAGYSFFMFDTPHQLVINFMLLALVARLSFTETEIESRSTTRISSAIPITAIVLSMSFIVWLGNIKPVMAALTFNEGAQAVSNYNYDLAVEKFTQAADNPNPYSVEFMLLPYLVIQPRMDQGQMALAFTPGTEKLLRLLADMSVTAVKKYPLDIKTLLLIGDNYRLLSAVDPKALDQATIYAQQYIKLADKRYDGYMLMFELALLHGDNQAALEWLDLTENLTFKNNKNYFKYINLRRACVLVRQRNYEEAAQYLTQIKFYPIETDARLIMDMAQVIQPGDQLGEIEPLIRKSLALFGTQPHVLVAGARIYHALGEDDIVQQIMARPALIKWEQNESGRIELAKLKADLNLQ
ncbi:O-antigen ligase family protein [Patescibacteria group bacterium]|nr:O-antigen ligase family protein [Patescibacteria group bacterium]